MLEFDDGDRLISQGQRWFYSVTEGRVPFSDMTSKKPLLQLFLDFSNSIGHDQRAMTNEQQTTCNSICYVQEWEPTVSWSPTTIN